MIDPAVERPVQEFQAVTANGGGSTHDLVRDLLAYCSGTAVDFDSIYAAVNAKVPQERSGLRAVLSAFPYFVTDERERWSFDPETHRKVLTALAEQDLSELPALFGHTYGGKTVQPSAAPAAHALITEEAAPESTATVQSGSFDFAAALAALKASTARLQANLTAPSVPAGSKVPANAELKPTLTRDQAAKLLSLEPVSVCDLLRSLGSGEPIPSGAAAIITAMSEFGWCEKKGNGYALTLGGLGIAFLERTRRLQAELRLLPAYQAAEQELRVLGTLAAPQLATVMRALPPPFRVEPRSLLTWLGWVVRERGLGQWAASGVTLSPDKRTLL